MSQPKNDFESVIRSHNNPIKLPYALVLNVSYSLNIHTRFPFGMYVGNVKSRGRRKARRETYN